MENPFPDTIFFDAGNGDYAMHSYGYDVADMETFVSSGHALRCPQYERTGDRNAEVTLNHFIRQRGTGRDIRLYLDLNIMNQILHLLDGKLVYGEPRYEKVRQAAARTLSFAGMMGARLMYGAGIIEYASHPNNTLATANERMARIEQSIEVPGQFWQRLAQDPDFWIPPQAYYITPHAPIIAGELHEQFAFYDTYQALLKIAAIEMSGAKGRAAYDQFLDWMVREHFFSSATVAVAAMQFLGQGYSGRPLKSLNPIPSSDNEQIIRNATWDVTHIRTFTEQIVRDQDAQEHCYVFCTLDAVMQNLIEVTTAFGTAGAAGRHARVLGANTDAAIQALIAAHDRKAEPGRFATRPRTSEDTRMKAIQLENAVYGCEINATEWLGLQEQI